MPVEYALPTLFRGRTVVVSGDENQMPPTAFFSSRVENDEADAIDEDDDEEELTDTARDRRLKRGTDGRSRTARICCSWPSRSCRPRAFRFTTGRPIAS